MRLLCASVIILLLMFLQSTFTTPLFGWETIVSVTRIPYPREPLVAPVPVFGNGKAWLYRYNYIAQVSDTWELTFAEFEYNSFTYPLVQTGMADGGILLINLDGSALVFESAVDKSVVATFPELANVNTNGGSVAAAFSTKSTGLIAYSDSYASTSLGMIFLDNSIIRTDTIEVGRVVKKVFLRHQADCERYWLCAVVDSSAVLDTISMYSNDSGHSWQESEITFTDVFAELGGGVVATIADGVPIVFNSCKGPAFRIHADTTVRLVNLETDAEGNILGYDEDPKTRMVRGFYVSTDTGRSFTHAIELDTIDGYVSGISRWFDGTMMVCTTTGNWLVRELTGAELMPRQWVEMDLTPSRCTPTTSKTPNLLFFHAEEPNYVRYSLFDLETFTWPGAESDKPEEAAPLYISNVFSESDICMVSAGLWTDHPNVYFFHDIGDYEEADFPEDIDAIGIHFYQLLPAEHNSALGMLSVGWRTLTQHSTSVTNFARDWPSGLPVTSWGGAKLSNGDLIQGSKAFVSYEADSIACRWDRYGVLRSTDQGHTWVESNEGLGNQRYTWCLNHVPNGALLAAASFAVSPFTNNKANMFVSIDNGHTWRNSGAPLPIDVHNIMRMSVGSSGTVYMAGGGLAKTTDLGDSWTLIRGNWPERTFVYYAYELPDDGRLLLLTSMGIYITEQPVTAVNEKQQCPPSAEENSHVTFTISTDRMLNVRVAGELDQHVLTLYTYTAEVACHIAVETFGKTLRGIVPSNLPTGTYIARIGTHSGVVYVP